MSMAIEMASKVGVFFIVGLLIVALAAAKAQYGVSRCPMVA